jgi:hypothetical protein
MSRKSPDADKIDVDPPTPKERVTSGKGMSMSRAIHCKM